MAGISWAGGSLVIVVDQWVQPDPAEEEAREAARRRHWMLDQMIVTRVIQPQPLCLVTGIA